MTSLYIAFGSSPPPTGWITKQVLMSNEKSHADENLGWHVEYSTQKMKDGGKTCKGVKQAPQLKFTKNVLFLMNKLHKEEVPKFILVQT